MDNLALRATLDWSSVSHGFDGMIAKAGEAQSRLAGGFSSLASTVGTAALAVGAAAGVAAVGAAGAGLVAFKSLEESASDAASKAVDIQGKSAEEIKAQYDSLKEHVMSISRELGAATVFDPKQVSDAFGALAAAGKDVSAVGTEQLRPMLDLAASDMQYGLGPATQLVMSTMAQFGMTMNDTGKIADVLAKGASGSGAGLGDFSTALEYVGPVSRSVGVDLETTIAMIAKLRDNGIDASTAGTSLRSSMLKLGKDTKELDTALATVGLTYADVDPRAHTYLETLDLLKEKGADAYTIGQIFGTEATSGVTTIMELTDEVRSFAGELENSQGVAKTMADLKMDSLSMDFEQAKGAAADLAIGLGEKLEPAARAVLQKFSDVAPQISELLSAAFDLDFGKIGTMLEGLGGAIVDYLESIDYKAIGESLHNMLRRAWGVAVGLFSSFLESDASLSDAFSSIGDVLQPTFEDVFNTLEVASKKAFMAIADAAIVVWNSIGSALYGVYNEIVGVFASLVGAIGTAFDYASEKWNTLNDWVSGSDSSSGSSSTNGMPSAKLMSPSGDEVNTYTGSTIDKKLAQGWVRIESASVSIGSANDSRLAGVLGEMGYGTGKLTIQSVENPVTVQSEDKSNWYDPYTGWLMENVALPLAGSAGERVAREELENMPTEDRTDTQNAIAGFVEKEDSIDKGVKDLQDVGRNGNLQTDEMNKWQKDFLNNYEKKWTDATLFSQSETGKQWQTEIDQLEELKRAKDAIKEIDPNNKADMAAIESKIDETKNAITNAVLESAGVEGPGMFSGQAGAATDWRSYYNASTGGFTGPTALYDEFYQWKTLLELGAVEAERNVAAIKAAKAEYEAGNATLDETIAKIQNMGQVTDAASESFGKATSEADNLKSTCVEVELSLENINSKAASIQFSRSSSAAPDALKQGIFETSATNPLKSGATTQMAGGATATGGPSNAALSAIQRFTGQTANHTNQTSVYVQSYGRSIYSAVQTTGNNTAAAINANGGNINNSVNTQGGSIVKAIQDGVGQIIAALKEGSGGLGGPHAGTGNIGSTGTQWAGIAYSPGYIYGFSEGGFAEKAMLAVVGDSPGGEFMVPHNRLDEFVSSYMAHKQVSADTTGLSTQLMDAVGSINIPAIHLPVIVDIDVDSAAIGEAVEYAIKNISSDIRLRARI